MRTNMTIKEAVREARQIYIYLCPASWPAHVCIKVTKSALKKSVGDLNSLNDESLASWHLDHRGTLNVHFAT